MKIPAAGELHGRAIKEWIGKSPDSSVPARVEIRILLRQNRRCAITGTVIRPKDKFEVDHIKRLKDGGENREGNLQIILVPPHKEKSAQERRGGTKVTKLQRKHYGRLRSKRPFPGGREDKELRPERQPMERDEAAHLGRAGAAHAEHLRKMANKGCGKAKP